MSRNKFFLLFCLFLLVSCASLNRKGYYLNESVIDDIKNGITHKNSIINTIGEPTYKIDDNTFLYHSYFENTYGIANTKSYNERILLLHFDDDGYIDKKFFKNSDISEFKYNKYKNDIVKNDENFFKDIFKNVNVELNN